MACRLQIGDTADCKSALRHRVSVSARLLEAPIQETIGGLAHLEREVLFAGGTFPA